MSGQAALARVESLPTVTDQNGRKRSPANQAKIDQLWTGRISTMPGFRLRPPDGLNDDQDKILIIDNPGPVFHFDRLKEDSRIRTRFRGEEPIDLCCASADKIYMVGPKEDLKSLLFDHFIG